MHPDFSSEAHILMCGDHSYFQHIAACLVSVLESNPTIFFSVVVLVTKSSDENDDKLRRSVDQYKNIALKVVQFDAKAGLAELPLAKNSYPPEIYARFWVEHYFDKDVERVIYLDGDMVIVGSIKPLLDIKFADNMLAAVQIPGSVGPARMGYDAKYGYFNSGMMVINLPRWRATHAKQLLISTAHELADKLNDPDQDVLNYCFHDQYIKLDYIWNAISPFFKQINWLTLPQNEISRVVNEVRIVHFNGGAKPWIYLCFHPYAKEYLRCVKQTAWKDFQPTGYSVTNFFKKHVILFLGERRAGALITRVRSTLHAIGLA